MPGYAPDISAAAGELGIGEHREALVLVVATPGAAETTVNLLAPVVVNEADGTAVQAILDGQGWPVKASLAAH